MHGANIGSADISPCHESWRRPACTDACTAQRVLVAEAGFRGWRDVVSHDHAAYEQALVWTVSLLGQLLDASPVERSAPIGTSVGTGPLLVDLERCEAWLHGRRLHLSRQEWRLLELLACRVGRLTRRHQLMRRLFSGGHGISSYASLLHRLRARLGDSRDLVETRPGLGLLLRALPVEV